MILNVPRANAFGIQRRNLVFNTGHVRLVFLDHDRLKLTQAVARHLDLKIAVFGMNRFLP